MTTSAVRIRRLDLRVRCRGPAWCMPSDHYRLAGRVREMVLAELGPLLASLLTAPEAAEAAVAAPVCIDLRLPASALAGGPGAAAGLRAQAAAALRSALVRAPHGPVTSVATGGTVWSGGVTSPPAREADRISAVNLPPVLLAVLLLWQAEGVLATRLARWDATVLARCCDAVLEALERCPPPDPSPAKPVAPDTIAAPPTDATRAVPAAPAGKEARPLATLLALVALAARHAGAQPPASALAAFRAPSLGATAAVEPAVAPEAIAPGRPAPPLDAGRADAPATSPEQATGRLHLDAVWVQPARAMPDRTEVATALPFLLLGPLYRTGWLEAAELALALGGPAHAPALGFALALKVLPAPARGWHHDAALLRAAALAAGLAEPPPGATLAAAERALGPLLGAADAAVADVLLRGHAPGAPLALVRRRDGLLALFEPEGLFLVALAEHRAGLESCIPVDVPVLAGDTVPDAAAVADGLGPDRPLAPGLAGGALDRSMTLAASLALGSMAWALAGCNPAPWAQPDPLLAFDRFSDLSARLRVSAEEVEVLLPLGPRARDLRAAGLLADVPGAPWLAGRRLRFGVA